MTEKLKTLMHAQVESVDFAAPDLDRLARAGDRRRRTRGVAALGGVVALAVAAALVVPALDDGGQRAVDPATGTSDTGVVTWATGTVIHAGDRQIDVGHTVNAYVRTRTGYVFADPDGTVWSWTGGEASEVGRTDDRYSRMVSDDEGTLAGWVDTSGSRLTFVVYDQADGSTSRHDEHTTTGMGNLADGQDPAYFYGIDGRTAYWRDTRGAVAVDLATGRTRIVDAEAANGFDLLDVEDGLIAFNVDDQGTAIGRTRDDAVRLPEAYGSTGVFSPGASWYSSDADEPQVYDARTGDRVSFDLTQRFATGVDWLDDSTLVMLAADRPSQDAHAQLLTCSVPEGSCSAAAPDLGTFTELAQGDFALPTGEAIDGD